MHRSQKIFPQRRQCVPRLAAVEASKAFPQTHSFMSRHEVHSMATSSKRSFDLWFPEANMIRLCITETEHTVEYSFSSKGSFPIIFFAAYCIRLVHVLLSRFYLDFILILSRFYPDFIQILSWFYPDFLETHFIQILSWFYLDEIWHLKGIAILDWKMNFGLQKFRDLAIMCP